MLTGYLWLYHTCVVLTGCLWLFHTCVVLTGCLWLFHTCVVPTCEQGQHKYRAGGLTTLSFISTIFNYLLLHFLISSPRPVHPNKLCALFISNALDMRCLHLQKVNVERHFPPCLESTCLLSLTNALGHVVCQVITMCTGAVHCTIILLPFVTSQ